MQMENDLEETEQDLLVDQRVQAELEKPSGDKDKFKGFAQDVDF